MRELSPLGGSEGMELATTKGAASRTRRLLRPWDLYVPCAAVGAGPRPARPVCTFGTRRGGACPSRRFCAAPFDWGVFRRPGGEPLLERSKRGEKIAGVCSDGQVTSILIWIWPVHSRYTPGPPFTGELG